MEQMVPELEDMVARAYFTGAEARAIAARRQAFEYKLKRKAPLLADFLAYIAYEADLDELRAARRARAAEAGHAGAAGPPGLADRAGQRRIHFIYARAVRKWRGDLSLWRAWLGHCAATGAARRGSRVAAAALALHPREPALWAAAAEWEFGGGAARTRARGGGGNPAAARALLQRGLRANPDCDELWGDYLRLELAYAATLRARRAVLVGDGGGKKNDDGGEKQAPPAAKRARKAAGARSPAAASDDDDTAAESSGDEDIGAVEGEVATTGAAPTTTAAPGTPPRAGGDASETEASRRVLDGGVAALVARSAVNARPASLRLRLALLDALHAPDVLAASLPGAAEAASGLYASLTADFPTQPAAWEAAARRHVGPYAPAGATSATAAPPAKKQARGRAAAALPSSSALPPADAAAAAVFDAGVAACPSSSDLWDTYAGFLAERAGKAGRNDGAPLTDALLSVYQRAAAAGCASEAALLAWPRAALAAGRVGEALEAAAAATTAALASAPVWKQRLVLEAQAKPDGAALAALAAEAAASVPLAEAGPVWEQAFLCATRLADGHTTIPALADAFVAALVGAARPKGPVSGGLGAAAAAALAAVTTVGGPPARRTLAARIRKAGPPPGGDFFDAFLEAEVKEAGGGGGDGLPSPSITAWFEDALAVYGPASPALWLRYAAWGRAGAGKGGGDLYWRATKALGEEHVGAFVDGFGRL